MKVTQSQSPKILSVIKLLTRRERGSAVFNNTHTHTYTHGVKSWAQPFFVYSSTYFVFFSTTVVSGSRDQVQIIQYLQKNSTRSVSSRVKKKTLEVRFLCFYGWNWSFYNFFFIMSTSYWRHLKPKKLFYLNFGQRKCTVDVTWNILYLGPVLFI